VRRAAAESLGRLRTPRESTLQALETLAHDEWSVSVDALLRLAPQRALPLLLNTSEKHRAMWRMDRVPELMDYLIEHALPGDARGAKWGDLGELARFQLEARLRRDLPATRPRGLLAEREGDPLEWAERVAEWGPEAAARAGVAAARAVLFLWAEAYPDDFPPMDALFLTERWILAPTAANRELRESRAEFGISQFCTPGSFAAGWACKEAARLNLREAVMWAIRARMGSTGIVPVGGVPEEERLTLAQADRTIRAAIARELDPWRRDLHDPLRDPALQRRALTG
jgi:hypothetical protein